MFKVMFSAIASLFTLSILSSCVLAAPSNLARTVPHVRQTYDGESIGLEPGSLAVDTVANLGLSEYNGDLNGLQNAIKELLLWFANFIDDDNGGWTSTTSFDSQTVTFYQEISNSDAVNAYRDIVKGNPEIVDGIADTIASEISSQNNGAGCCALLWVTDQGWLGDAVFVVTTGGANPEALAAAASAC